MDGGVEQSLAPPLGAFAVARILLNVGDHAGGENALPIVRGINAAIEMQRGASQVSPALLGHLLQGFETLGKEPHIRFMDGSHGDGSEHRALVVDDGDDFLALVVLVAGRADAIPPFLAPVLVPSPWSP